MIEIVALIAVANAHSAPEVLPDAKIIATLVAELWARAAAVSMAGPHPVREACSAHWADRDARSDRDSRRGRMVFLFAV
jgi:hypothetical protein